MQRGAAGHRKERRIREDDAAHHPHDRAAGHRPGVPAAQEPGAQPDLPAAVRGRARVLPGSDRGGLHGRAPARHQSPAPGARTGSERQRLRERPRVRIVVDALGGHRTSPAERPRGPCERAGGAGGKANPARGDDRGRAVPRERGPRGTSVRTARLRGADRPAEKREPLPERPSEGDEDRGRAARPHLRATAGGRQPQALLDRRGRDREAPEARGRLAREPPGTGIHRAALPRAPKAPDERRDRTAAGRQRGNRRVRRGRGRSPGKAAAPAAARPAARLGHGDATQREREARGRHRLQRRAAAAPARRRKRVHGNRRRRRIAASARDRRAAPEDAEAARSETPTASPDPERAHVRGPGARRLRRRRRRRGGRAHRPGAARSVRGSAVRPRTAGDDRADDTQPRAQRALRRAPRRGLRHRDHRFEWTRAEFVAWAEKVAERHGYEVETGGIGPEDAEVGAPSQRGRFIRCR